MVTQTKKANETAGDLANAVEDGVESSRQMAGETLDRAAKGYEDMLGWNRGALDAYVQSANTAAKCVESLNAEIMGYTKQAIEDNIAATKALLGARTVQEFFDLQSDYTKAAFDNFINRAAKMSDMLMSGTKDMLEPLSGRAGMLGEGARNGRSR